jgi:hypothetical protein
MDEKRYDSYYRYPDEYHTDVLKQLKQRLPHVWYPRVWFCFVNKYKKIQSVFLGLINKWKLVLIFRRQWILRNNFFDSFLMFNIWKNGGFIVWIVKSQWNNNDAEKKNFVGNFLRALIIKYVFLLILFCLASDLSTIGTSWWYSKKKSFLHFNKYCSPDLSREGNVSSYVFFLFLLSSYETTRAYFSLFLSTYSIKKMQTRKEINWLRVENKCMEQATFLTKNEKAKRKEEVDAEQHYKCTLHTITFFSYTLSFIRHIYS